MFKTDDVIRGKVYAIVGGGHVVCCWRSGHITKEGSYAKVLPSYQCSKKKKKYNKWACMN